LLPIARKVMRFACPADPDLIADFGAVISLQRKSFVEGWNKLVSRINMVVKLSVSVKRVTL